MVKRDVKKVEQGGSDDVPMSIIDKILGDAINRPNVESIKQLAFLHTRPESSLAYCIPVVVDEEGDRRA